MCEPSTCPKQMTPSVPNCKHKYTVENCLPSYLHNTKSRSTCNPKAPWSQSISAPYPSTQSYAAMIHQQYAKKQQLHIDRKGNTQPHRESSHEAGSNLEGGTVAVLTNSNSLLNIATVSAKEHRKPIVSKIGAAGRKIADAMKSVKSQKREQSISLVHSDQAKSSQ